MSPRYGRLRQATDAQGGRHDTEERGRVRWRGRLASDGGGSSAREARWRESGALIAERADCGWPRPELSCFDSLQFSANPGQRRQNSWILGGGARSAAPPQSPGRHVLQAWPFVPPQLAHSCLLPSPQLNTG